MVFFKHELKMNSKSLAIWSTAVGIFIFAMLLVFPQMGSELNEMSDMYANLGAFSSMFNLETLQMGNVMGFYGIEVGAILSLGGAMFAAILGAGILAKEEANHTTEYIYVTPNTRTYFITQKVLAVGALIVIFNALCLVWALVGMAIIKENVEWNKFFMFHLAQLLMHLEIGAICFGISAYIKKMNLGLGIGISLVLYFLHLVGNMADVVEGVHYITPFYYSDAATVYENVSIPIVNLSIGMAIAVIGVVAGYMKYTNKDLSI